MFAIEELTVLGSAENKSVSRGDICCSYLGKHQNLCLGWVGEGSHATIGIATSSTVTSLCIPLACVKTIFNPTVLRGWWISPGFGNPRDKCFLRTEHPIDGQKDIIVIIYPGNSNWDFNSFTDRIFTCCPCIWGKWNL